MSAGVDSGGCFARLFEMSGTPMLIYDLETLSILAVNDAAAEFYGLSRPYLLSMSVWQLHPAGDQSPSLDIALRSLADSKKKEIWRHVRKDGAICYLAIHRVPTQIGSRRVCAVIGHDVSEAQRAELLNRMLLDSVPSSVLLLDENLRVVLANRNFLEKSRQTAARTISKRLAEVFPEVIVAEMGLEQQVRNVLRGNEAKRGQRMTYRTPGVPIRVYYYSLVPVRLGEVVDHVLLVMDDVTEQMRMSEEIRKMERHVASVVESASDLVLSTDIEGRILTWNKAAERTTGYALSEVKGSLFFDWCNEKAVKKFFAQADGGEPACMTEGNLKTRDGKDRSVSWVLSKMTSDARRVVGFVVVGRDLTEQRKLEMQILESQKLAALGVMARGIAHEIRTPLTVASSAAQFISEGDLTPEFLSECADRIYRGIHRASTIIEDLLRFAQPTTNLNKEPVNVCQTVENALRIVENQARVQNIEIGVYLSAGGCFVLGIAGLLEQVFTNLFLNAIRAMPDGGALTVSSERSGGYLIVRTTDKGRGIAPADLNKIFDPFYTKAPPGKGTGLGLSICHSIVEQHKGSIGVESQLGVGSTFTVRLPLLEK